MTRDVPTTAGPHEPEGERDTLEDDPRGLDDGTLLDGQYRITGLLGRGGMGAVYRARDERLERDVAIKVVRPDVAAREQTINRFRAEARAMARLSHPHVVGIHALGEYHGRPYLVMEYVPGTTLSRFVAERGTALRVEEALAILDQVCRGVSAMHAAGVVHRDLKPANILVGPSFRVVVSDLGLSRSVGETNDGWGTPGYAAPEMHDSAPVPAELAPRADVYAIGVLAFELLTGSLPFESELVRLSAMADELPPDPPSTRTPRLGTELDDVILSALAWRPEERTTSVDVLRRALGAGAATRPQQRPDLRILVADDDPSYGELAGRVLARTFTGARIEIVEDGASALDLALARPPDLVVADLDMPGLDGIALTAALRADPRTQEVPIVIVSAIGATTDWALLERLGADAFLGKPFDPSQLTALARAVVD